MTKEEAIKIFNTVLFFGKCDCPKEEIEECLKMAIKALEQEPCDDAISRQAVLDIAKSSKSNWIDNSVLFKRVNELPPVTPQPKVGHNRNEDYADCDQFVCSECGIELQDWHKVVRDDEYDDISYQEYAFRFCPSCGCEIKEVEE